MSTVSGWCMTRRAAYEAVGGSIAWSAEPAEIDHPGCLYAKCSCPCHNDGAPVVLVEELPAILAAIPEPTI